MYIYKKVGLLNIVDQFKINKILYVCGKDMAENQNLHHWNNSYFKNLFIILLCALKNDMYIVKNNNKTVATFQTKKIGDSMHFEKLACLPSESGRGIGSYCVNTIEKKAELKECEKVTMEVYDQSSNAIKFYYNRGYRICGSKNTLKFKEIVMEKYI